MSARSSRDAAADAPLDATHIAVQLLGGARHACARVRLRSGPEFSSPGRAARDAVYRRQASQRDGRRSMAARNASTWERMSLRTGGACSSHRQLDAVIAEADRQQSGPRRGRSEPAVKSKQPAQRIRHFLPIRRPRRGRHPRAISAPPTSGRSRLEAIFNLFTLSASVSYALDIFGGQRRLIEGLHAQVDVAHANEQAAYLALASNIVNTVIARAAYRAEVRATQQLIGLQKEQVRLAEVQSQAGTVPYSTVLSLRSQLASYEATIPQLEQKASQSAHLLVALTGHLPAQWIAPEVALTDLTLPADLPVSLPSALVRQRPDILAAEATAHAASANIGVATAALLPNLTLNGGLEAASNSSGLLFPANGKAWSLGAAVTAPLFEGGTLWFKRKAALDNYREAMALYRQTVLGAFEQVPTPCVRSITMRKLWSPKMNRWRRQKRRCAWFRPIIRRDLPRILTS